MPKNYFFLVFFALTPICSEAQISISATDFPSNADTVRYSNTDAILFNYTATGPNYTWNFPNLAAQSQTLVNHADPDEADIFTQSLFGSTVLPTYRATYYLPAEELPLATLSNLVDLPIDEINRFYRKTNQEVTVVGLSIGALGFAIGKRADTIEVAYKFPMIYGQTYESDGYVDLDLSAFAPFSLKQYRERVSEVDGWGTITTPYGTFDCLRIHHVINELDSVLIDLGQGAQWYNIDIPVIHEYEWWTKDQKGPILKVKANEIFGFPIVNEIMFRDNYRPNLNVSLDKQSVEEVQVFPNPVNAKLNILNAKEGAYFVVLNELGQKVIQAETTDALDISHLKPGVYFLVSVSNDSVSMPIRFVKAE